jgi:hypothetical protein
MVRSRLGLKALGLCALVLGLMAFATSAAHAEKGSTWVIINAKGELLNIPGATDLLPQLEIKEIENNTATLSWTTGAGTKVKILCTAANFDEGGKLIAEGGLSLGRILFKGCVTLLNGVISPPCKPKGGGAPVGEILTNKGKGLIVLDLLTGGAVDTLVLIKPDEGTAFSTLALGEECAIGESITISGELWIKDCKGETSFKTEAVEHLIEEALHGLTVSPGAQPAVIEGSALVRLANPGEHAGLKWAGLPSATKP